MKEKQPATDLNVQTANTFINVRDVRGSILYTRDGQIICFICMQPVSIELLSYRELYNFLRVLTAELSSERKTFKFLTIPRPVDINHQIAELMRIRSESGDAIQRGLLKNEILTMSGFALSGDVMERQFYFMLWEAKRPDNEKDLLKRAADFIVKLGNSGVRAELCAQGSIVQLLNQVNNPAYAHIEDNNDMFASIPMLNMEGGLENEEA